MTPEIHAITQIPPDKSLVWLIQRDQDMSKLSFTKTEAAYVKEQLSANKETIEVNSYFKQSFIITVPDEANENRRDEAWRKKGAEIAGRLQEYELSEICIKDMTEAVNAGSLVAEGMALASYRFDKYKTDKKECFPQHIRVSGKGFDASHAKYLHHQIRAVFFARDLVNEPHSTLNAPAFSNILADVGKETGLNVSILDKRQIESLKMGGVLAVNQGSVQEPRFNILEWKPENAKNNRAYVLVGKGVMFDTGGMSLKPTKGSMDEMKSDMGGAATVAGTMMHVALNKLPLHVIGLIPATDNRPGKDAYLPQDVIKMFDGTQVEVLNTDAEGRMILADALAYAKKLKPELVIDLATLTGSAEVCTGNLAAILCGNDPDFKQTLIQAGDRVYERLVELPVWEEYAEFIKSDVADIKNVGGKGAGAITAAKFLEHFTDYPWMHVDIAGTAYIGAKDAYRPKGGTGYGVRLLSEFFHTFVK